MARQVSSLPISDGIKGKVRELAAQGRTTRAIANMLGVSKTFAHLVTQKTIRSYPIFARKGYTDDDIWSMYFNKHLNTFEIEQETGISHETIRTFLHQHGGFTSLYRTRSDKMEKRYRLTQGRARKKESTHGCLLGQRMNKGYTMVYMPEHHRAHKDGYVYEHILVWEQTHDKKLPKNYIVHHRDGDKSNNSPDNLSALHKDRHRTVYQYKIQRIKALEVRVMQLEAEIVLLRKALENGQAIFYLGDAVGSQNR